MLPGALLAKAHMPDLTKVVPAFDVESIEATPDEQLRRLQLAARPVREHRLQQALHRHRAEGPRSDRAARAVQPGLPRLGDQIDREVDFGASERQLYFLWRLRELTREELELALDTAGGLFKRVRMEMEEGGVATYPTGPWYAGLEHFPGDALTAAVRRSHARPGSSRRSPARRAG